MYPMGNRQHKSTRKYLTMMEFKFDFGIPK